MDVADLSVPSPLRGEIALTQCMETLQEGYLHAVCAAARCTMAKPIRDRGIDWAVYHSSTEHTHDAEAEVRIQLKSTYQVGPDEGDIVPFTIENTRLARLTKSPVTISAILVGMVVPREISDWISNSTNRLAIRHCCYWANLEGHPITGKTKTTVHVPKNQIFDDVALCEMMSRIGKGGKP